MEKILNYIADNKDSILETLKNIAITVGSIWAIIKGVQIVERLFNLTKALKDAEGILSGLGTAQIFGVIAGVGIILAGIIKAVIDIGTHSASLVDILNDLSIVLVGIGTVLVSLNASNPFGWISIAIGLIGVLATSFMDNRTEQEKLKEASENLAKAQRDVNEAYQEYVNAGKSHLSAFENAKKEWYNAIKNGDMTLNDLKGKNLELYRAYLNNEDAQARLKVAEDKLTTSSQKLTDAQKEEKRRIVENTMTIAQASGDYSKLGKAMEDAYNSGAMSAEEMAVLSTIALNDMDEEARQVFVKNLPDDVKLGMATVDKTLATATAKEYVLKFGMNTSSVTQKLNSLKKDLASFTLGSYIVQLGTKKYAKGGIVDLPKLAPGGLINRPGPGVAIGGERGTEGVVPLTDSQQMERLGMAIGRYVNIRAEIPVSVGNRQIAREIRNINADESFAYNG